MARHYSTTKGFARTSKLLQRPIAKASESRGFAQSRVLTHWAEIAGEDVAAIARPVDISYARGGKGGGMGATLTLLTTGAQAPMLEMQKDQIRERVNQVYGYSAIARIRITQTAPTGFADGAVAFGHAPRVKPPVTDPEIIRAAQATAQPVTDDGLRSALETLGRNILSKTKR